MTSTEAVSTAHDRGSGELLPRYLNGRVLLRQAGGVQRYATEIAARLANVAVLTPSKADRPSAGRLWEQTRLARSSADGVLLSPAHSGPLTHPRQVVVVHDLLALDPQAAVRRSYRAYATLMLPRLIKRAARIVAVSPEVAGQIADQFGIRLDRITIASPGVSDVFCIGDQQAAQRALDLDETRPVVAALLDPTPRKHSATVARMLQDLEASHPYVQVIVAGGTQPADFVGPRNGQVSSTRPGRDLGRCDDVQLATMLQAADVFVSLSNSEGYGLPVLEAAACGAAVVSPPVPSLAGPLASSACLIDNAPGAYDALVGLLRDLPQARSRGSVLADLAGDLRWGHTAATLDQVLDEVGE